MPRSLLEQYLDNPSAVAEEWRAALRERARGAAEGAARARAAARAARQGRWQRTRGAPVAADRPRPSRTGRRVGAPAPAPAAVDEELLGGVAAAMSLVKAIRTHGHLAARLDPLGSEPPGDPALEPERLIPKLTPELMARIPATLLRLYVDGRDARRRASRGCARSTAARSPTRSSTSPTTRSACGCGRRSSPAATGCRSPRREGAPARPAQPGRGDGALPSPRVPRPEAVLDRGRST